MFRGILPREERFFDLFQQLAKVIALAAEELSALVREPANAAQRASRIQQFEKEADGFTHQTIELLRKAFITPLDRNDIHELVTKMDDIIDFMDAAAQRIMLFEVKSLPPAAVKLAKLVEDTTKLIQQAIDKIHPLKDPEGLQRLCREINHAENEADQILRASLQALFRDEPDVRNLIKVKEIVEIIETVTDRCEDVANVIEGIVVEYA